MSPRSALFDPSELGLGATSANEHKKLSRELFSTLQADIQEFRHHNLPPIILSQIRDLPIYKGNIDEVKAYHNEWKQLIDRAKAFYPSAYMPPECLPLPASLEIPQFIYNVRRINLTKTKAKESKKFGSVGALSAKCGDFSEKDIEKLNKIVDSHERIGLNFNFVAHRAFIDLRAYVFCKDSKGNNLEPQRVRFYRTSLIIAVEDDFEVMDSRQTPRKTRADAYSDPVADNGIWKVYLKVL